MCEGRFGYGPEHREKLVVVPQSIIRHKQLANPPNVQNSEVFDGYHPSRDCKYAHGEKCARSCLTHELANYKTAKAEEEVAGRQPVECTSSSSICQHETCWTPLANARGVLVRLLKP